MLLILYQCDVYVYIYTYTFCNVELVMFSIQTSNSITTKYNLNSKVYNIFHIT